VVDPVLEEKIGALLDVANLEGAATIALRGYGPQLLGYLRAMLGPQQADDAFSIFCESVWKELPMFRRQASFVTWAYQLAWGAAQRVRNQPYDRRATQLSTGAVAAIAQEVRTTTAIHLRQETSDLLARIRSELEPEEQSLLVLRIDRDLSWEDVATIMSIDAAALRKRFERLKEKIRVLAQRGKASAT
jgi:RNA polymerase sigma-70 factor (ECF subfamily)